MPEEKLFQIFIINLIFQDLTLSSTCIMYKFKRPQLFSRKWNLYLACLTLIHVQ